jgi:hypothetical protein
MYFITSTRTAGLVAIPRNKVTEIGTTDCRRPAANEGGGESGRAAGYPICAAVRREWDLICACDEI